MDYELNLDSCSDIFSCNKSVHNLNDLVIVCGCNVLHFISVQIARGLNNSVCNCKVKLLTLVFMHTNRIKMTVLYVCFQS